MKKHISLLESTVPLSPVPRYYWLQYDASFVHALDEPDRIDADDVTMIDDLDPLNTGVGVSAKHVEAARNSLLINVHNWGS
jgi:hypothetical protein